MLRHMVNKAVQGDSKAMFFVFNQLLQLDQKEELKAQVSKMFLEEDQAILKRFLQENFSSQNSDNNSNFKFYAVLKINIAFYKECLYIFIYQISLMKKDLYFVAVKVFLRNKDKHLLINKDVFGDWDIPGGRLRENDFDTPLENVVTRKIKEELGEIEYNLGKPIVFMRHERNEILPNGEREKRKIFAIGYDAEYFGGKISLGKNHEKYEWVNLNNFKPEEYFTGGWLNGINDYINLISKGDL